MKQYGMGVGGLLLRSAKIFNAIFLFSCFIISDFKNLMKVEFTLLLYYSEHSTILSPNIIVELGWKTIEELIDNEFRKMVFKSLNDLAPQYLCNLFTRNSACSFRNLPNTEIDLRLPKKNSANGQNCFSLRGVKLWNSFPAESKTLSSLNGFKKSIKH